MLSLILCTYNRAKSICNVLINILRKDYPQKDY